jgi:hypothetical protein
MPGATLLNHDDPIFAFEHMMQHRQYFAVMRPLDGFTILPYLLDPTHNPDHPAWNWNQKHQQAHDDFNATIPSNSNNGYTLTSVVPPVITALGTSFGDTALALFGVSGGTIIIGSTVSGPGVSPGTTIVAQVSGPPGGDGAYLTNLPTLTSNFPLTITHPAYDQANPIANAGTIGIHQPGILIEGEGETPERTTWWTFQNHQHHLVANGAILPLPTTAPQTAGSGPGTLPVSNPWWWAGLGQVNFPFW